MGKLPCDFEIAGCLIEKGDDIQFLSESILYIATSMEEQSVKLLSDSIDQLDRLVKVQAG